MGKRETNPLFKKSPGRQPCAIVYSECEYEGKEYGVGFINTEAGYYPVVFDKEDTEKVTAQHWHITAGRYASTSVVIVDKKKELAMHNLVLDRFEFNGRGATETVDHISRNSFDNRKANLRIVTASEQTMNHGKISRKRVVLPDDCDIDPDSIPTHIWYVKPNGLHGDRFAIEFKTEGLVWRSTSSKKVSLKEKFEEAKLKLLELYCIYPHLDPYEPSKVTQRNYLLKSFNEIVEKAAAPLKDMGLRYVNVVSIIE